ncbi:MAG: RNA-binding protein [Patescibacteria group bacterium]
MSQSLYVGNLPYSTTEDQLKDLFSQAGDVASATVITDKFSGRSKGFGFVEMADADGAKKAIAELNGHDLDGRSIRVSEARPKEERKGGFGGGRRFDNREE